ncbi:unnamed protein product [Coccothraustes coccothraustes]
MDFSWQHLKEWEDRSQRAAGQLRRSRHPVSIYKCHLESSYSLHYKCHLESSYSLHYKSPGPRTCPSLPTPGCAAGQSSFRPNTQTPVTQNNKKQRTQQGEKALGQKNASQDQEKAGPDDLGESDGEPMRLREPWRNKTLSEGLSASVAKMPARESYCQNPLPILQFLQVLIG